MNDGSAAAAAIGHLDIAAAEEQLGNDPVGDDLPRSPCARDVDGLDGRVRPLRCSGLCESCKPRHPRALSGPTRKAKLATGVLHGHEDARSSMRRQGPRRLQGIALDSDGLLGGLVCAQTLHEDDTRGVRGNLGDDPSVHADTAESCCNGLAEPGAVIHYVDPSYRQ